MTPFVLCDLSIKKLVLSLFLCEGDFYTDRNLYSLFVLQKAGLSYLSISKNKL